MFSYTDDAIVTSSPTGRHLSTVIRRPAGMPDNSWTQHADQVCKVLNELDSKAKANSLSLHLQTVGRVKREEPYFPHTEIRVGAHVQVEATSKAAKEMYAEVIKQGFAQDAAIYGDRSLLSFGAVPPAVPMPLTPFASARIAELEKQLDDATTKLAAAQMLLEKPIEVTADLGASRHYLPKGGTTTHNNRTFKRVE